MKWIALPVALLGLASAAFARTETTARDVLVVLAHPDDELVMAPAIARLARDGNAVTLVFATSGDQGPGVSELPKGQKLADAREEEARCSAKALGASAVIFLGLGDGTLASRPQDAGSPARQLAAKAAAFLSERHYDKILTWGPDGGYGHGDHRIVSAIMTQVVQAGPQRGPALLYPGIRAGTLPSVPQMQDWAVTDPSRLPIAIGYGAEDLAAARRATQCHATQFSAVERAQLPDLFHATVWQGAVHFRSAFAQDK